MFEHHVKRVEHENKWIDIYVDTFPSDPREWDNLGTMVCGHGRYSFGDIQFNSHEEMVKWKKKIEGKRDVIYLPIYMYEHGQVGFHWDNSKYPFNCRWDSGRLGWIYTTHKDIRENFLTKRVSKKQIDKAYDILKAELRIYENYVNGEVYGFQCYKIDENGHEIDVDSCSGFYGYDFSESGLINELPYEFRDDKELIEQL